MFVRAAAYMGYLFVRYPGTNNAFYVITPGQYKRRCIPSDAPAFDNLRQCYSYVDALYDDDLQ